LGVISEKGEAFPSEYPLKTLVENWIFPLARMVKKVKRLVRLVLFNGVLIWCYLTIAVDKMGYGETSNIRL